MTPDQLAAPSTAPRGGFHHEVLLYEGWQGFVDGTLPFIRNGIESGDRVVAAVSEEKTACIRDVLGDAANRIVFIDETAYGRNPNRFIAAWRSWVEQYINDGQSLWGISEPTGKGLTDAEREEHCRHEVLLNLAFEDSAPWRLLCSYDTRSLGEDDLHQVRTHHPYVRSNNRSAINDSYSLSTPSLSGPLPQPDSTIQSIEFDACMVRGIRELVTKDARSMGLSDARAAELALAVNELATNSIRHGGGRGEVRWWQQDDWMVCDVKDSGRIDDIWAGRMAPPLDASGGRGLWLVNQLCDLMQIRSDDSGGTVRVSMSLTDTDAPDTDAFRQEPAAK